MGKGTTKTDNGNLAAKLALRRHFLAKYHADQRPYVLDCCAGSGVIWSELRGEGIGFDYWAVDEKPKKGRLKINSVRILQQPGWPQDLVDIDTYGSPWKHWMALLPNVVKPISVFLTIGLSGSGPGGRLGSQHTNVVAALGLDKFSRPVPAGLVVKVQHLAIARLLHAATRHNLRIVEAAEATRGPHARYIGVRLAPESVE